jgi:dienelactone hydrolase
LERCPTSSNPKIEVSLVKFRALVSVFALMVAAACVCADEVPLKAELERPILEPGVPLNEMRAFVQPRIIKFSPPADKAAWEKMAAQLRRDMLDKIVFRGTAAEWRGARCGTHWFDTIDGGPGYRIRKFRYEALPGTWIPGLLYLPDKLEGRVPVAVNVNGHAPEGKAVNYKQLRSINLAKRGMLVLNVEWFGMGQLRTSGFAHGRMNQLDLCGASGLAPFYLALERAVDIAVSLEHADSHRIVVSGLSGGGWQTILISSLDERVALANPVAGYGSFQTNIAFDDMGDSEQAPTDMAMVADYAHLTALRAPRPTLLTYNAADDCCFKSGHTLGPLLEAARPVFALYGAGDKLRSHVNSVPGTHNFERENREKFYAMVGDFFYPADKSFARAEIASEAEIKTADELNVPLPANNIDFHRLAEHLMAGLPARPAPPLEEPAAESWRRQRREQLRALLKIPNYDAASSGETTRAVGPYKLTSRVLKIGTSWSVPAVEIATQSAPGQKTTIVIADGGRSSVAEAIGKLADGGVRVLAIDPLLVGESQTKAQDPQYTYPLFMSAVGERPLGIQAAQLVAIARWSRGDQRERQVNLIAWGPRASAAALVAAAIAPDDVRGVEMNDALTSLKQLIEQDKAVESLPELFAFGLLKEFDIRDIAALVSPRAVTLRSASP